MNGINDDDADGATASSLKHKSKDKKAFDLSSQFEHTTVIHSIEESVDDTFNRLKEGCMNGVLSQKEIIDGLFNLVSNNTKIELTEIALFN